MLSPHGGSQVWRKSSLKKKTEAFSHGSVSIGYLVCLPAYLKVTNQLQTVLLKIEIN